MIIRTGSYSKEFVWEKGMSVCIRDGLWDEQGKLIPGAKVWRAPTDDDPVLVIEWSDAQLERLVPGESVSLNLKRPLGAPACLHRRC